MWKEEEQGTECVGEARITQAIETGAENLTVACPFFMIMLTDAAREKKPEMRIADIVEWVVDRLVDPLGML